MTDYKTILQKVGWVLIAGGIIDILVMIYCVTHEMSYSSSFNIFAVIAGIFLLRGSLKAARIISFFAAFISSGCAGGLFILPFFLPFGLLLAYTRHETATVLGGLLLVFFIMALLVWIYRQLTSTVVLSAMDETRIDHTSFWRKPTMGFWVGGCLCVFMLVFMPLMLGGATAQEAKRRAADQVGQGYKFAVTSLNMSSSGSGKHVFAEVAAYNDTEITNVVVEWSE
jgi:uncharacterized membrane protein YeiB